MSSRKGLLWCASLLMTSLFVLSAVASTSTTSPTPPPPHQHLKHFGVSMHFDFEQICSSPSSLSLLVKQWKSAAMRFATKGVNTFRIRIPFHLFQQQIQTPSHSADAAIGEEFDVTQIPMMQAIDQLVAYVGRDLHSYAILELEADEQHDAVVHNFDKFAHFWSEIAQVYKYNNRVIYSLLSRPSFRSTETWVTFANGVIAKIRDIGSVNLILLPGNRASDIKSWNATDEFGVSNTDAMLNVQDPFERVAFEFNLEYPASYEFASLEDVSEFEYLRQMSVWLDQHVKVGFLSEFSGEYCDTQLAVALRHMEHNRRLWLGWSWEMTSVQDANEDEHKKYSRIADVLDSVMLRAEELDEMVTTSGSQAVRAAEELQDGDAVGQDMRGLLEITKSPLHRKLVMQDSRTHCHYACPDSGAVGLSRFMTSVGGIGALTALFVVIALVLHP